MDTKILKDALGWGFALWLIGYILGFALFFVVPFWLIGWIISPIGILITLWVLFKKISGSSMLYYFKIAVVWAVLAVVLDYIFLVKMLNPADGYYKPDVYLYYIITLVLPVAAGWYKLRKKESE